MRDAELFAWSEANADALAAGDVAALSHQIERSALAGADQLR